MCPSVSAPSTCPDNGRDRKRGSAVIQFNWKETVRSGRSSASRLTRSEWNASEMRCSWDGVGCKGAATPGKRRCAGSVRIGGLRFVSDRTPEFPSQVRAPSCEGGATGLDPVSIPRAGRTLVNRKTKPGVGPALRPPGASEREASRKESLSIARPRLSYEAASPSCGACSTFAEPRPHAESGAGRRGSTRQPSNSSSVER